MSPWTWKKNDNSKFAAMNLNDSTECTVTYYLPVPFSCNYYYAILLRLMYSTNVHLLTRNWVSYLFSFSGKPGRRYLEEADPGPVPMWWPILYTCCGPLCLRCWLPCSSGCSHLMPVDLVYLRSAHLYLRRLDGQPNYHQIYFYILNLINFFFIIWNI